MGLLGVLGFRFEALQFGPRALRCDMALVLAADDGLEAYSGLKP